MGADRFVISLSLSPVRTNTFFSFRCLIVCLMFSGSLLMRFAESKQQHHHHHHYHRRTSNFVSVNYLPNGEVETRVHYNGISAKETSVSNRNNSGVMFRELTDGRRFIQLIYENGTLKDCDYGRRKEQIQTFLNVFDDSERRRSTSGANRTASTSSLVIEKLDASKPLPKKVRKWFNYPKLRKLCRRKKRHQHQAKKKKKAKKAQSTDFELNFDRSRTSSSSAQKKHSLFVMPGTLWCGDQDVASRYNALGLFSETDRCCRRHDYCRKNIHAYTRKFELFNGRPFTISHCYCDSRPKRDMMGDLLRIPGTHWCGKGYSATKYTQLGLFSRTDRCCRTHDLACPFWIGGMETKYGLHNFRANTLMHCSCDERFRACLKMVGSSDADIVGKIFFNWVQTKCFVIKRKRICAEYEGKKCVKKEIVKKAVLKTNLPY